MIAARCTTVLAMLAPGALLLAGCSETMSLTQLPDITKLPEKVLSQDEQKNKVEEMVAKAQKHQTEAVKEIEGGK